MEQKYMTWTPPKKWTEVYPYGTKEGDEEHKFFIALARSEQFKFRSIASIAKRAKLTEERVIEIIEKYKKLGMVLQSKENPDNWAYWERVPKLTRSSQEKTSISTEDLKNRIKKASTP